MRVVWQTCSHCETAKIDALRDFERRNSTISKNMKKRTICFHLNLRRPFIARNNLEADVAVVGHIDDGGLDPKLRDDLGVVTIRSLSRYRTDKFLVLSVRTFLAIRPLYSNSTPSSVCRIAS